MPTHSLSDYTSWIERTWQGQVSFTELVTYAETLNSHPALCAALYRTWLQRNTGVFNSVAWFNLGVILFAENNLIDSIEAFQKALALSPAFPQARINLGLALERQGNAEAAIEQWQAVVENAITPEADQNTGPNQADQIKNLTMALNNIGRLQETRRQYQAATQALEKSLQLDPDQPDAIHHLIFQRQKQCQWPVYAPVGKVTEAVLHEHTSALAMLNISDAPEAQLTAALNYSRRKIPADLPRLSPANGYRHDKIRVAYCSSDFCTHPVAMLTVELFEHHDKNRFETYAFCWSPDDGSTLRQRILSAVDHYIPVHGKSDDEVAQLIRQHEIDILIDLQGQTSGAKTRMLAMRPAPMQITYLGLPATTGLPGIDYVIADRYLIPEEYARFYSEKPLYMPDVYQVSDRKREHSPAPTRKDCGLPARKFVFCSFNNNHKYTLEVFTTWMNILRRVPNSVLWLLADNPWARENLQKQAKAQGIDPKRLVFAERTMPADYLARYLVADLFLDTFPFNAGTTANDALWMGLPVLTMSGRSFASRMAGALLTAADLPELITHDLQTYEDKAVALAADAKARKTMRQKLALAKESGPLFDSLRFTRNLEQQYIALVSELQNPSQHINISAQPEPTKLGEPAQPNPIIATVQEAEALQARGDTQGAIQLYRQWLEHAHSGDEWIAQFNLGVLLRDGGDITGAQQAFQAVLKQKPDFVQARAALGKLPAPVTTESQKHGAIIGPLQTNSPISTKSKEQITQIFSETPKIKLLVEGWRGINHSFALVNQYHLYEWMRSSQLHIYHRDMPLLFSHWETNKNRGNTGLPGTYSQRLAQVQHWSGQTYDACFRIYSPVTLAPDDKHPVSTFLVTELGLDETQIAHFRPNLKAYFNMGGNIVTPSHWSKERIIEAGIPAEHIHLISHGVASNIFHPMHSDERAIHRQRLGFDREAVIFLNVAAPIWNKGLDLLIQAFVQCFHQNPHTRLLIKDQQAVYGISTKDTVLREITLLGESKNESLLNAIRVIPDLNLLQLRELYCIADYYVSPYRAEGFNLPVIEALVCGTPVIVTEGGATQDFCSEKNALFIEAVPYRNVKINDRHVNAYQAPILDSLITHLNVCAQDKPFSESQRLQNAASIAKNFTWAKAADTISRLFTQSNDCNTSTSQITGALHEEPQYCN